MRQVVRNNHCSSSHLQADKRNGLRKPHTIQIAIAIAIAIAMKQPGHGQDSPTDSRTDHVR